MYTRTFKVVLKLIVIIIYSSCSNDNFFADVENTIEEDSKPNSPIIGAPERVAAFGPNGTHWPNLISTPFIYDNDIPNKIIVDADWDSIKKGIEGITDVMANEGAIVLVRPGTLVGNGAGGGSKAVLRELGSLDWKKRITLAPLNGYGSVSITGGAKFYLLYKIAIAGFIFDSVKIQGCSHSALAWCKVTGWSAYYGEDDVITENVEIVELVHPDSKVLSGDTADAFSAGGPLRNIVFEGCYYAPRYFEFPYTGAKPHTDTLQFSSVGGGGEPTDISFVDTALFASNNASLQTGGINKLLIDHSYIVSGSTSLARYPHLSGGATEATKNAINGSGKNFIARNSVIIGGIALNTAQVPKLWNEVTNTLVNKEHRGSNIPLTGSWTVDLNLNETNSGMPPYPTTAYLESIWSK